MIHYNGYVGTHLPILCSLCIVKPTCSCLNALKCFQSHLPFLHLKSDMISASYSVLRLQVLMFHGLFCCFVSHSLFCFIIVIIIVFIVLHSKYLYSAPSRCLLRGAPRKGLTAGKKQVIRGASSAQAGAHSRWMA